MTNDTLSANDNKDENSKQNSSQKKPFLSMPGLYKWQEICVYILAGLTLIATLSGGLIDIIMGVAINSLVLYGLFRLGNVVYKKIKN